MTSKNKSIAYFKIELLNKSIVQVKAYDDKADYIYIKLKKGQSIIVEVKLRDNRNIECDKICFLLPKKRHHLQNKRVIIAPKER